MKKPGKVNCLWGYCTFLIHLNESTNLKCPENIFLLNKNVNNSCSRLWLGLLLSSKILVVSIFLFHICTQYFACSCEFWGLFFLDRIIEERCWSDVGQFVLVAVPPTGD